MILLEVRRFHVLVTAKWGLKVGRGYFFTYVHVGALLFGWINRHDHRPR